MDFLSRFNRFIEGELTPGQRRGAIALAILLFCAAVILYLRSAPLVPIQVRQHDFGQAVGDRSVRPRATPPREVVVHIAGAVSKPGIYRLPEGARVDEAIRAAGGPLPSGLIQELNLAARLVDGQKIVVPAAVKASGGPGAGGSVAEPSQGGARGSGAGASVSIQGASGGTGGDAAGSSGAGTGQPIDLNTATPEQLDALPGVGPAIAKRILEYREGHGGFRTPAELQQVKGIGPKKYQEIKGKVSAGP